MMAPDAGGQQQPLLILKQPQPQPMNTGLVLRHQQVKGGKGNGKPPGPVTRGTVRAWYPEKGFGFVTPEDGGADIFVHKSALTDGLSLLEGTPVTFQIQWDTPKNKNLAVNVIGAHANRIEREPTTNLFIAGLPLETTEDAVKAIFGQFGAIVQCKLLDSEGKPDKAALVRMNDLNEAVWMVDNLHQNIPLGLSHPIVMRYADNRTERTKTVTAGIPQAGYGKGMAPAVTDNRFSPYEMQGQQMATQMGMPFSGVPADMQQMQMQQMQQMQPQMQQQFQPGMGQMGGMPYGMDQMALPDQNPSELSNEALLAATAQLSGPSS